MAATSVTSAAKNPGDQRRPSRDGLRAGSRDPFRGRDFFFWDGSRERPRPLWRCAPMAPEGSVSRSGLSRPPYALLRTSL